MQGSEDEDGGDVELQKQLLDELMQFARGGMAKDMRRQFGKPLDDAPLEEEAPEDPNIPGVEASASDASGMGAPAEEEIDPETLKAILASMQGG